MFVNVYVIPIANTIEKYSIAPASSEKNRLHRKTANEKWHFL